MGRGEEGPLCDPGSELLRERESNAGIINGMGRKKWYMENGPGSTINQVNALTEFFFFKNQVVVPDFSGSNPKYCFRL